MRALFAGLVALLVLTGCSPGGEEPQTGLAQAWIAVETDRGPVAFDVQMATTDKTREKGLMFVKALGPKSGMLFDFGKEGYRAFWMKNTLIPLDIIYIKADGTISTINENAVPLSETPIPSSEPVRAVLEIAGGGARTLGIEPGAKVHAGIFGNGP